MVTSTNNISLASAESLGRQSVELLANSYRSIDQVKLVNSHISYFLSCACIQDIMLTRLLCICYNYNL